MSRIVLTTIGSFGDLHPKVEMAFELRRRGHRLSNACDALQSRPAR